MVLSLGFDIPDPTTNSSSTQYFGRAALRDDLVVMGAFAPEQLHPLFRNKCFGTVMERSLERHWNDQL